MPKEILQANISIKYKTYLNFKNPRPDGPLTKIAKYPDGMAAEFSVETINDPVPDFVEHVTWRKPNGETTVQTKNEDSHNPTWDYTTGNKTYILRVHVLSSISDDLPDGFWAKRTSENMEQKFYIRNNDGTDFLRHRAPDEPRALPVTFNDEITAMMYLELACDNPNYYSVVHHIEQHPVQTGWLIRTVAEL